MRPSMRALPSVSVLLISACLLPGCSTPSARPPQAPQPAAAAATVQPTPEPTPETTPEPAPQPGPSHPAGATPALGSHPPAGETPPAETVDIRGKVVQARRNAQGEPPVGTLQVEGALDPDTRYAKATVHIGHKTRIFLGRNGKPASFSFIHSGDFVEVTFESPPAEATESAPVKGTAATIVILEHKL